MACVAAHGGPHIPPRRTPVRTKIVATLGPACTSAGTLRALTKAGVAAFRINLAHGSPDTLHGWVRSVRSISKELARPVAVLADLAGPKIRVRGLPGGRLHLSAGHIVPLVAHGDDTAGAVPVDEPRLLHDLKPGDPVFLADGSMELRTLSRTASSVRCRVVTGGLLLEGKGVNVPRTRLRLPSMTAKDRKDLRRVLEWGVDAVALSFVRRPADLAPVQRVLKASGLPLYAKIEKAEAVRHLEPIVEAADGVMVARGDLGVETSLVEIPMLQKRIIATANAWAKPVITATQMLRSMVEHPYPTRAEATDVANAILDGTDAVMLSEETAMGQHPVRAVETMAAIARNAEPHLPRRSHHDAGAGLIRTDASAVSHAAAELAEAVGAVAIVTPTRSGATARFVARLRPGVPVVALTRNRAAFGGLLLTWGVLPFLEPQVQALEDVIAVSDRRLVQAGLARPGGAYVLTAGFPAGGGDSNLLTVQHVRGPRRVKGKPKRARRGSSR